MNAYFRMSDAILDCPCALELGQAQRYDQYGCTRLFLFIRLLVFALSPSKCFTDAQALAVYVGVAPKQTQRVWDVCIKHGVLRKAGYGYSAREWLVENGFIGRYDRNADADRVFKEGLYGKA